jgi:hypothetical protein
MNEIDIKRMVFTLQSVAEETGAPLSDVVGVAHAMALNRLATAVREFTCGDSMGCIGTSGVEILAKAIRDRGLGL